MTTIKTEASKTEEEIFEKYNEPMMTANSYDKQQEIFRQAIHEAILAGAEKERTLCDIVIESRAKEWKHKVEAQTAQAILADFDKQSEKWVDSDGWLDIGQQGEPPTPLDLQIKFHKFIQKYLPAEKVEK